MNSIPFFRFFRFFRTRERVRRAAGVGGSKTFPRRFLDRTYETHSRFHKTESISAKRAVAGGPQSISYGHQPHQRPPVPKIWRHEKASHRDSKCGTKAWYLFALPKLSA